LGLIKLWKKSAENIRSGFLFLTATMGYFIIFYGVIFFGQARFRFPILPILAILAAYTLVSFWQASNRLDSRKRQGGAIVSGKSS